MHGRITFGVVFGFFVLVVGASMALDLVFGISFPIIRAAIALLLIAWGARVVTRSWSRSERAAVDREVWFGDRKFVPAEWTPHDARYDVVFGRGVVDLTQMEEPKEDVTITVDTVFGNAVVKVDPTMSYDVVGHAAFGEVRMPDRTSAGMGSINFQHPTDHAPRLHVRLSSVFGSCHVIEVPVLEINPLRTREATS